MSEDLLQLLGIILFGIGLCLFISSTETCPVFERQPEETGGGVKPITREIKRITPATPPPPPSPRTLADEKAQRLEAIRRWQSQKLMDDREMWQIRAARARSRNPADDVNPPRIPPKIERW